MGKQGIARDPDELFGDATRQHLAPLHISILCLSFLTGDPVGDYLTVSSTRLIATVVAHETLDPNLELKASCWPGSFPLDRCFV